MAWSLYTHASLGDVRRPRPLAVCDRCGFTYNRDRLRWQYEWAGIKEMNMGVLVCNSCMDSAQPQLKAYIIPPDPIAIRNPRPGEFSGMTISSSPNAFDTVVPSQIVAEGIFTETIEAFQNNAFQNDALQSGQQIETVTTPVLGTIGNRTPITTEPGGTGGAFQASAVQNNAFQVGTTIQNSSLPLLTEVTVTPNPDPNFGDGGYTRGAST